VQLDIFERQNRSPATVDHSLDFCTETGILTPDVRMETTDVDLRDAETQTVYTRDGRGEERHRMNRSGNVCERKNRSPTITGLLATFYTEVALAEEEDPGYRVDFNGKKEQNMIVALVSFRSYASFEHLRSRIHTVKW
jgi:hypothetical protein